MFTITFKRPLAKAIFDEYKRLYPTYTAAQIEGNWNNSPCISASGKTLDEALAAIKNSLEQSLSKNQDKPLLDAIKTIDKVR